MGIAGVTGEYSSFLTSSAASQSKMDKISGTDYSSASDAELMGACKQFEEYLVEMAMKEVAKTVDLMGTGESSDAGMATTKDIMKDRMVRSMSEQLVASVDLGIAQKLYDSMSRQYGKGAVTAEEIQQ